MDQWQKAASEQVQLVTGRLTELLSRGQLWLRTELGVDLGLKPELLPPWLILSAACTGLLLMLALWASLCRAVFRKQPAVALAEADNSVEVKRAEKPAREEPKRRKKKSEKKSQPNGRAVVEQQEEEAVEPEEIVPHHHQPPPPEVKTEKAAEVKKSKKKAKQTAKEPAKIVTTENKEPEEGTWETKVSNKEKREQRKKDKGSSDGSSSPGGGDTPVTTTSEQPKGSPAAPANQKKKKGGDKVKPEKAEPVVPKAPVKPEPASAPVLMTEPTQAPQALTPKPVNWATNREPASLWTSEIDSSWTVIDRSSLGTFSGLGVSAAEPKSVSELPWLSQPAVDDEWSGINGGSIDCNSDWNAPSEVWGNYEEPALKAESMDKPPAPEPEKNNLIVEAADEDNEKEKDDLSGEGVTKSKRKKKKKKKAADEGVTVGQGEESEVPSVKKQPPVQETPASVQTSKPATSEGKAERTMKENAAQKQPVTQVPQKPTEGAPTANSSPPALTQQKKPEEIQAPKPAKKKKARRET